VQDYDEVEFLGRTNIPLETIQKTLLLSELPNEYPRIAFKDHVSDATKASIIAGLRMYAFNLAKSWNMPYEHAIVFCDYFEKLYLEEATQKLWPKLRSYVVASSHVLMRRDLKEKYTLMKVLSEEKADENKWNQVAYFIGVVATSVTLSWLLCKR
jgi:hypothetical protein